jgi:glycosyltransferase involved in cell wall biosynthesis
MGYMLSVVVLAKNEEGDIGECLKTLIWADEILVINDESTDNTVSIIENLKSKNENDKDKIRIFTRNLNGDFSKQRNFGLEKSKGEWVLFVDADERVSSELKSEIQSIIHHSPLTINGYSLKREDHLFGKTLKHGENGSVRLLRLGKREAGKWEGKVHETWNIKGKTEELDNPLEHYPHQTISAFLEKINDYSTLRAEELYEQGIKTNLFLILAYTKGKFLQDYFLKLGFLDGMPGLIVALLMSFHSFLVRSKLYLLWKQKEK